jgi:hypothetical protein
MLMLGFILVIAMLIAPEGVFTGIGAAIGRLTRRDESGGALDIKPAPAASNMMPKRS